MAQVKDTVLADGGKFQPYTEYKYSGAEWLGIIPVSWNKKRLKYLAPLVTVKANARTFPVGLENIEGWSGRFVVTDSEFQGDGTQFEKGDLLFGKLRPYLAKLLLAETSGEAVGDFHVMRPVRGVSGRFLQYQMLTKEFISIVDGSTFGAKMPRVSWEFMADMVCALPRVEEQRTIAAFLDYETARIDQLIAKQQRLIELLKEKRQAVISHAVTKGLNPNASMKDSGVEWLGQVPEHWSVQRLKHVITALESGCSVNAADTPAEANEVGVLKTSCVYTRSFRANENKTVLPEDLHRVKCPVRKGSIIISRMNTPDLVGASALVDIDTRDIYLPDRLWQSIFNKNVELEPEYLAYFMTVKGFRAQISLAAEGASSSMQNIAKEDYLAINCLLPPFMEQIEIIEYLKAKLQYFDRLDASACRAIYLLQERRTALISAAVTGKIDVRSWNASNERNSI